MALGVFVRPEALQCVYGHDSDPPAQQYLTAPERRPSPLDSVGGQSCIVILGLGGPYSEVLR